MNGSARISKRLRKRLRDSLTLNSTQTMIAEKELKWLDYIVKGGVQYWRWSCPRCRRPIWKLEKPTTLTQLLCNPNGSLKGRHC